VHAFRFEEELKRVRQPLREDALQNYVQEDDRAGAETSYRGPRRSTSAAGRDAWLINSGPVSFRPRRATRAWWSFECKCNCSCH